MKTLWVLEDHAALRESLSLVFEDDFEIRCSGCFGNVEAMLKALANTQPKPDVLLLDIGLPGRSGLEALGDIRQLSPTTMVVVLTVFEDDEKVFRAICAGATGYLLKTLRAEELVRAVKEALSGGSPMSPKIARRVLEMFSKLAPKTSGFGLTEREHQILRLIVAGLTNKELSAQLCLSVHTVDAHLRHIYGKLEVHNRSGAVAKALRERLA